MGVLVATYTVYYTDPLLQVFTLVIYNYGGTVSGFNDIYYEYHMSNTKHVFNR